MGMKRRMAALCLGAALVSTPLSVFAAPKIMWNGLVFDPQYYAAAYPDAKAACGENEDSLMQHYMSSGQDLGYLPYNPAEEATAQELKAAQAAWADAVKAQIAASQAASPYAETHSDYYKNVSKKGMEQADAICSSIARAILNNHELTTDLDKVGYAAMVVAGACSQDVYGTDAKGWYRSPYGVFVSGTYTCAGSTRTLGRILDFMGYKWVHHGRNKNAHQWCEVMLDGQPGYADGMGGFAGYGSMESGMTLPDGRMIFFPD